jgi:hypothetical protein
MAAMRDWLDAPTRFVYDQTENALVISVEFPNHLEGEAVRKALRRPKAAPTVAR